jgi:hypothetical protein
LEDTGTRKTPSVSILENLTQHIKLRICLYFHTQLFPRRERQIWPFIDLTLRCMSFLNNLPTRLEAGVPILILIPVRLLRSQLAPRRLQLASQQRKPRQKLEIAIKLKRS